MEKLTDLEFCIWKLISEQGIKLSEKKAEEYNLCTGCSGYQYNCDGYMQGNKEIYGALDPNKI